MTRPRDLIGEYLEELGVDQAYNAADALVARLVANRGLHEGTGVAPVQATGFVGYSDASLLRQVADWLEAENRVLVGLWSTGFGSPLETHLQVISDPPSEAP